jgi:hypothetical protein
MYDNLIHLSFSSVDGQQLVGELVLAIKPASSNVRIRAVFNTPYSSAKQKIRLTYDTVHLNGAIGEK